MRALGHGALGSSMARGAADSLLSWVCAELLAADSAMPPHISFEIQYIHWQTVK